MKSIILTIIITLGCYSIMIAQFSDENTELINQYFQLNVLSTEVTEPINEISNYNSGSFVEVVQTGIENNIRINSLQNGDEQIVNQKGNKNNYEYYNYYSQENSAMQVNQNGTANSVQVFGENSLMKDAVINQKSDFNTIVVRNYSN